MSKSLNGKELGKGIRQREDKYTKHYKHVKEALGWRKLNKRNLVVMQDAINNLRTDNERKNSKKILVDML